MPSGFKPNSRRFFELREVPEFFETPNQALRLLLLADDRHPAGVVQDHIRSICDYSQHRVTVANSRYVTQPDFYKIDEFDAILIHYSIFIISESYLSREWQRFILGFRGAVAVIHEDEYQKINTFKKKFAEFGVKAVFSCLDSKDTMEHVYGGSVLSPDTFFFSCLPGYIASQWLENSAPPTLGRHFDIIYRGRTLQPELGLFAQEKRLIGEQMLAIANANGLTCDISSAEQDRIYGSQWPIFLRSGKAMLGVEGGASIFDFDGKISEAVADFKTSNPDASFEEIWQSELRDYEGNIDFRTITPKFFEAIAAKTVLVLYPGKYNNLLLPDRHYIPLERDGSNAAEVVAKLRDDDYLQKMADRTFDEIIPRYEIGSKFYVNQIDRVLYKIYQQRDTAKVMRS